MMIVPALRSVHVRIKYAGLHFAVALDLDEKTVVARLRKSVWKGHHRRKSAHGAVVHGSPRILLLKIDKLFFIPSDKSLS